MLRIQSFHLHARYFYNLSTQPPTPTSEDKRQMEQPSIYFFPIRVQ